MGRWPYHLCRDRLEDRLLNIRWKVTILGALLGLGVSSVVGAAPGWVWLDDRGQKVFSDLPPPANVPNQKILRQPGATPATATPEAESKPAAAPSPQAKPAAAPTAGAPALTEEQRKIQAKEDAQRKSIERRNAEIRADNCARARESLATLSGGGRLATTNEQGQRVIMDPAMRNAERARVEQIIADNCR